MSKNFFRFLIFFISISFYQTKGQQFFENFDSGIPSNWLITNNNGRVVVSNVTTSNGTGFEIPSNGEASDGNKLVLRNCETNSNPVIINVSGINMASHTDIKIGFLGRRTTGTNNFDVPVSLSYSIDGINYTVLNSNAFATALQSSYTFFQ